MLDLGAVGTCRRYLFAYDIFMVIAMESDLCEEDRIPLGCAIRSFSRPRNVDHLLVLFCFFKSLSR